MTYDVEHFFEFVKFKFHSSSLGFHIIEVLTWAVVETNSSEIKIVGLDFGFKTETGKLLHRDGKNDVIVDFFDVSNKFWKLKFAHKLVL